MLTRKFKYQLLKEQYVKENKIYFEYTSSNLFNDKISRKQRNARRRKKANKIYMATIEDVINNEAAIYSFYDKLFSLYMEKTDEEDLFLSYWRKRGDKENKFDLYRLMGVYELKNCNNEPFGKYFILLHFSLYKSDEGTQYESIRVKSIRNKYYLTLEEIKKYFELVTDFELANYKK